MSTREQHAEEQTDPLDAAAGCERVFVDHASVALALALVPGRRWPMRWATSAAGDTLVVTKLDRLGRSVKNLK